MVVHERDLLHPVCALVSLVQVVLHLLELPDHQVLLDVVPVTLPAPQTGDPDRRLEELYPVVEVHQELLSQLLQDERLLGGVTGL